MKRLVIVFALFLLVSGFMFWSVPNVKAVPIEVTRTFTSQTYDGDILNYNQSYGTARNSTTGNTIISSGNYFIVGQTKQSTLYYIHRGFLYFSTSLIPDEADITSATVSLYVIVDDSLTDFNVTVQNGQPTYPHIPMEKGDYYYAHYSGVGGSKNTTTISGTGYWNVTLNADGIDWINKEGTTKLALRSSRDINNIAPSDDEDVGFYQREKGEAYSPKLYVTYEIEGYKYIVHGPYWESGAVANKLVNVTLSIENMDPYKFVLNGSDGVADTETIQIEQRGTVFTWNLTSPIYNTTRTYYLTDDTFEELWIYIPNLSEEACYLYTFTVTDFVGVTNAYLETVRNVGGQNRVVERQSLDLISPVPFWMIWASRYDVRLVCDQGTYSWGGFVALTEQSQSLIILVGMFPVSYPGLNVTVQASRMNATWVQVNYTDSELATDSVQILIRYKSGFNWVTAYSYSEEGNTHQVNWYSGDEDTDYVVAVTANRGDDTKSWSFSLPKPPVTENPWEGIFDALGEWPFPPENLIALVLVLAVFAVFSYASMPIGCVCGVIFAGFFVYIGWLDVSWSLIALAFAIAIFAWIARAKREEREI